uniref:Uncharacterized protein n=1 Tax=Plectus sambesii TaxID=2011161 RepID=A0A914VWR6_9BILA
MSGTLYQDLGREKALLFRYIDEAGKRDYPATRATPDLILAIQQKRDELLSDQEKIKNCADRLQVSIDRLVEFIATLALEEARQKQEQKKLDGLMDGKDGTQLLLENAYVTLDALAANLRVLANLELEQKVKSEVLQHPMESLEPQQQTPLFTMNHPVMVPRSTIQLPKLELCTFDGTITEWQQFWETFKATVHDEPLPSIQKMSYLRSKAKKTCSKSKRTLSV